MESIIAKAPPVVEAYDVNTKEFHSYFNMVKTWLEGQTDTIDVIDHSARELGNKSIPFRTVLKFIQSEKVFLDLDKKVTVSLINPVYKETGRLQRREEHPHGENSLRNKIACLDYFASINSNFSGRIIVVDDECPVGSGKMAQDILLEYPNSHHQIHFLGEAIDRNDPDLPTGLTHKNGANRSVKGGAALFGMKKTLKTPAKGLHIIVDNDADLSVHPMQLGLIIQDIVQGKALAVAGSRRERDSVAIIGDGRNGRGALFIRIWQHFLPQLSKEIIDTNRAFKAYESSALEEILPLIRIYTFPFQIELLQACISNDIPLVKRAIAYIDSEAASTQNGAEITETYLNQIHQIIDIAKRYDTISREDPLMKYFLGITNEEWSKIESKPPGNLHDLV